MSDEKSVRRELYEAANVNGYLHYDEAAKIAERYTSAPSQQTLDVEWQPMESAPKDGTIILGDYSLTGIGDDAHTVLYMKDWHGKGKGQWRDSTCTHDFAEPLRWMPLPKPACKPTDSR